jgi:hypothetical protein
MTDPVWSNAWFGNGGVGKRSMHAWRGVEAQHVVSTMRLVDTAAEQEALENLLESSKPAAPPTKAPKHYLLFTPFRYRPKHDSRFRPAGSLGIWYGAEKLYAACAEVAYWRHRFILDSAGLLEEELLTEHTFFEAKVQGTAIDLMKPPWVKARSRWTDSSDYSATQSLANEARERGVQWIRYESARAPGYRCAAVLDVEALDMIAQGTTQQTWHCKASRHSVMFVHGTQTHVWSF